jgi:predicted HD phosphohydrolase
MPRRLPPAREIALSGARVLASEHAKRAAMLAADPGADAEAIEAERATAARFRDMARHFERNGSYVPASTNHRECYQRGLKCC